MARQTTYRNGALENGKYTSVIRDGGDVSKGTGNSPEDARSAARAVKKKKNS